MRAIMGGASSSGRWMRQGRTIVVDLGGRSAAEEQEVPTPPTQPFWQRVIHPRIDVDAQRALISMEKSGNPTQVADALFLLGMVEAGPLFGIFKPDQRVPALLVRSKGGNWWEIIRPGTCGRFLCHSTGRVILVIAKNLTRDELISCLGQAAAFMRTFPTPIPCP